MTLETTQTWRDVIARQIRDPQERQRLADAIGVRPVTLTRWVQGSNTPSMGKLALYLQVTPSSANLLPLLAAEFPEFNDLSLHLEEGPEEIPAEFYHEILKACTVSSEAGNFRSIGVQILQYALEQLDPQHRGLTLLTQICQPSASDGMVHSLRATLNVGTPPWQHIYENLAFFGAESLSGYSVMHNRPVIIQDINEKQEYPYPFQRSEHARSFCMYPLQRHHRVAGCLWVGSTQPHYFSAKRATLIEQYANLMQLLFPSEAFYDLRQIHMQVLPTIKQQQHLLATAPMRIQQILQTSTQHKQASTYTQAELIVWQQLEEELITLAISISTDLHA